MDSGVRLPLTFKVFKGETLVRTETLTQSIVKIGKLSSSHLRLDDESVSRMHAVIEVTGPDDVYIIDLGSARGTVVNGKTVNKCRLESGDEIQLGDTRLVVTMGAAPALTGEPVVALPRQTKQQATLPGLGPSAPPPMVSAPSPVALATPPTLAPAPAIIEQAESLFAAPSPLPATITLESGPSVVVSAEADAPTLETPPAAPAAALAEPPAPIVTAPLATSAVGKPAAGPAARPAVKAAAPAASRPEPTSRKAPAAAAPGAAAVPGWQPAPAAAAAALAAEVEAPDGGTAVEVTSMFEDSVLDVHVFSDPGSGKAKTPTLALLGSGALAILFGMVAVSVRYIQAGAEKARLEEWLAAGKDASQFIAAPGNPILAFLVAAAMLYGLVAVIYGLWRVRDERKSPNFVLGNEPGCDFALPPEQLPAPRFPLVRSSGTGFSLLFTPQMKGDVSFDGQQPMLFPDLCRGGRAHSDAEVAGAYSLPIQGQMRAKVDLGDNTFLVHAIPAPRKMPVPLLRAADRRAQAYNGGSVLAHAVLLGLVFMIPPDPKALSLDVSENLEMLKRYQIKPVEEKEEDIPEWLKKKGPDDAGGKGKRHKFEEGKMGSKKSKEKDKLYGLKGPKDNPDMHLAKQLAEEEAKSSGLLGVLKRSEGSHLASIFGRDSALGSDAENALGGLVGTEIGEAYGMGGLGLVGSGPGGGGTGEGTIGLGNLGTIGKGGGGGSGSGYGRGAGHLGGRRARAPEIIPGQAQVRGSLDKEIIRRIIRQHINEFRYCYEKELVRRPELYGRVQVQFTISGQGAVVEAHVLSSTMSYAPVEQCVANVMHRLQFPKPVGGGIVVVMYPFVFKAAGGEGE